MNVTPFISADNEVTLNIRPTITRILGFKNDPNPNLTIPNQIPEIQVRELEDTPSVRGMIEKIPHLVEIVEERG